MVSGEGDFSSEKLNRDVSESGFRQLAEFHQEELRASGPALSAALSTVVHHSVRRRGRSA